MLPLLAAPLLVLSFGRLHLLLELLLLSGRQDAEDLLVKSAGSGVIARTTRGMRGGELVEQVLNLLLLLPRKINAGEPFRPAVIFVSRLVRLPLGLSRRLRHLCGHGDRQGKSREQRGYAGDFHGVIIAVRQEGSLKEALGTGNERLFVRGGQTASSSVRAARATTSSFVPPGSSKKIAG